MKTLLAATILALGAYTSIAQEKPAAQASSEQETQPRLMEAEEQLRIEQAKLGRLQDELERLDKALEDSSRQGSKQQ